MCYQLRLIADKQGPVRSEEQAPFNSEIFSSRKDRAHDFRQMTIGLPSNTLTLSGHAIIMFLRGKNKNKRVPRIFASVKDRR